VPTIKFLAALAYVATRQRHAAFLDVGLLDEFDMPAWIKQSLPTNCSIRARSSALLLAIIWDCVSVWLGKRDLSQAFPDEIITNEEQLRDIREIRQLLGGIHITY